MEKILDLYLNMFKNAFMSDFMLWIVLPVVVLCCMWMVKRLCRLF